MSEPKNRNVRDYSEFDQMSTEMLEEILRKDFESGSETSDMDLILHITGVIAQRNKENPPEGYHTPEEAWELFQKNYLDNPDAEEPYIDDELDRILERQHVSERRHKKHHFKRWLTGIVAAVMVLVCGNMLTTNAAGCSLWDMLVQWTGETFGFTSEKTEDEPKPQDGQYNNLKEALAAYGITEELAPEAIPNGYLLQSIIVKKEDRNIYFTASYQNETAEKDELIITIKHIENGNYSKYEKNNSSMEIYKVNGITHYLMDNFDFENAVWKNNVNECTITGKITREEIKKMIQSVYE